MIFSDFIVIKHMYFSWINVNFKKKNPKKTEINLMIHNVCFFPDSIKHVRQKYF